MRGSGVWAMRVPLLNSSPELDKEKCVMEQKHSAQDSFSWTLKFSRTLVPPMKSQGAG